jgi:Tfp pilus assembly protein PilF
VDDGPVREPYFDGRWYVASGFLLLAIVVAGVWYTRPRTTDRPKSKSVTVVEDEIPTFESPFLNTKLDVAYVGDAACAECHADIEAKFRQHPMGRSSAWVEKATAIEKFSNDGPVTFEEQGLTFQVAKNGDKVVHRIIGPAGDLPAVQSEIEPQITVGSGAHGRSYWHADGDRLYQSPVTWYVGISDWGVSPGFDMTSGGRRAMTERCVDCHADGLVHKPNTLNAYEIPDRTRSLSVGCERCHGPGATHVAHHSGKAPLKLEGDIDHTIVNPKHLAQELRIDVCRQCHFFGDAEVAVQGKSFSDFRPGLPVDQFMTQYAWRDGRKKGGNTRHLEQMLESECYQKSGDKLDCTSCHDPHEKPDKSISLDYFRSKCLSCHTEQTCTETSEKRTAKQDACTECHMPRREATDVNHTSLTDHSVPRAPLDAETLAKQKSMAMFDRTIEAIRVGPRRIPQADVDRNRGIALSLAIGRGDPVELRGQAMMLLREATERDANDGGAWLAIAKIKMMDNNAADAFEAANKAFDSMPDSEVAATFFAELAVAGGENDRAIELLDKMIKQNPRSSPLQALRGRAEMNKRNYGAAEQHYRAAIEIAPLVPAPYAMAAICAHHQGKLDEAKALLEQGIQLLTKEAAKEEYRQGFESQTKGVRKSNRSEVDSSTGD